MRWLFPVVVVLIVFTACASATLSDLSDLARVEKMCGSAMVPDIGDRSGVPRELSLIRKTLTRTRPSERSQALHELAQQTKWGTPERLAAYYVCAWYGVDYVPCREYLLNTFYWEFSKWGHSPPSSWAEDTLSLLYILYQRNHDFRLLHEMVTKRSGTRHTDGCGSETLDCITVDAFAKHPRGMLHVAAMSDSGNQLAVEALTKNLKGIEVDQESFDKAYSVFAPYVRRVAADREDPLSGLARSLLKSAEAKS